jgi:hypothetical protein
MIGAFAADDPFPDKVVPPDDALLAKLPPLLRRAAGQYDAVASSSSTDTVLKRVRAYRSENRPASIFKLAWLERKLADWVSRMVFGPPDMIWTAARALLRSKRDC